MTLTNGYDKDTLVNYIERIENLQNEIDSERGTSMQKCKTLRADKKEVYGEAKEAGFDSKALKVLIENRGLQKKIDANIAALEADQQDAHDRMIGALGDLANLPLGQAAIARAQVIA